MSFISSYLSSAVPRYLELECFGSGLCLHEAFPGVTGGRKTTKPQNKGGRAANTRECVQLEVRNTQESD